MIVINSPADFKEALASLGVGTNALSKIMKHLGDDRPRDNIRRNLQRMAAGEARVPGEMRAMLNMLALLKEVRPDLKASISAPEDDCPDDDEAADWQERFIR
jgi:hypothetical protein